MFSKLLNRIKYFLFQVHYDWEIGYTISSIDEIVHLDIIPKIKWFKMPRNVFWADPFGIKKNEHYYIFYEEYHKDENYGTINCIELDIHFNVINNKTVIDEKIHFSFPQVFESNGEIYMIPETCNKKKLSLYKCTTFPWEWIEETVLIQEPCVDSVLYQNDNFWFLFYSKATNGDNLYIRKNNNLKSNWENCEELIINKNPKNSRNGGAIIESGNAIYRISQDCSKVYGEKVGINQIIEISPENYSEIFIKEISLNKGLVKCCHTLNRCGEITLIDRRRERLYLKPLSEIFSNIKKKYEL